ncbi:hypothetical protein [Emticicia sp. 17c]|uniref:hypothetical protein n=1 Tax=Emticicia sp. 17c TaxID=3127704 RepID=UPI00301C9517
MRFIEAFDLANWSQRIQTRSAFSRLLWDLIWQTCDGQFIDAHFPIDDYAQVRGHDGFIVTNNSRYPSFVPIGTSIWEIGVGLNYLRKCNDDYNDALEDFKDKDASQVTFVFVTLQAWDNPRESIVDWKETKKDTPFKDIIIIDGTKILQWLELFLPVALRLAHDELQNRIPPSGVRSISGFWEGYSLQTNIPIAEELLLAGRKKQSEGILEQMIAGLGETTLCGETSDEVIAFLCAIIQKAQDEQQRFLKGKCLIVEDAEAAKRLSNVSGMILIVNENARRHAASLKQKNKLFYAVPMHEKDIRNAEALSRPSSSEFAEALKIMGLKEEEAYRKSISCNRLLQVYIRLNQSANFDLPIWRDDVNVIPALLAGAWDCNLEPDTNVLQKISDLNSYEGYEQLLVKYLQVLDPPLWREQAIWKIRSPLDAFILMHRLITPNQWKKLKDVCIEVFSDVSVLEIKETDDFGFYPKPNHKHSEWLRNGLSTTLLTIAALSKDLRIEIPNTDPQNFVNEIFDAIPNLSNDYRILFSLKSALPYLAEAAPNSFLNAVAGLIGSSDENIRPIINNTKNPFLQANYQFIIWSLELLAWDPNLLTRASLLLAKLANIEDNKSKPNRALSSLKRIFLPWHPSTNASSSQRLAAIDKIISNNDEVSWVLLSELLPNHNEVTTSTTQPRFRDMESASKERLTYAVVWKMQEQIVQCSIKIASDKINRWEIIINRISQFGPVREKYNLYSIVLDHLEKIDIKILEDETNTIWHSIINSFNRMRRQGIFINNPELISQLDRIESKWRPIEQVDNVIWLFNAYLPTLPNSTKTENILDLIQIERSNAIREIVETEDIHSIIELVQKVKLQRLVAQTLIDLNASEKLIFRLAEVTNLKTEFREFLFVLSSEAHNINKDRWLKWVIDKSVLKGFEIEIVNLLFGFPDNLETWKFVNKLGKNIESIYWSNKIIFIQTIDDPTIKYAIKKGIKFGRALNLLGLIDNNFEKLSPVIIKQVLDAIIKEIQSGIAKFESLTTHYLKNVFEKIYQNTTFSLEDLGTLEYSFLSVFEIDYKPSALFHFMANSPSFFVEILSHAHRASGSEIPSFITNEERAKASIAYRLLSDFNTIPGEQVENNPMSLREWVDEVLRIATQNKRLSAAEQYIGYLLAHSGIGKDGAWPSEKVRQVIETLQSHNVESGLELKRFNMRGATIRSVGDGGSLERELAQTYETWAKACDQYPQTASLLLRIARMWHRYAKNEDDRERLSQFD